MHIYHISTKTGRPATTASCEHYFSAQKRMMADYTCGLPDGFDGQGIIRRCDLPLKKGGGGKKRKKSNQQISYIKQRIGRRLKHDK